MKFKIRFSRLVNALLIVVAVIAAATLLINILAFADVRGFTNAYPAMTIISIVVSLVLGAFSVTALLSSNCELGLTLKIKYGIIPVLELPYNNIIAVIEDAKTHNLFLQYIPLKSQKSEESFSVFSLNLSVDACDDFVKSLLDKRPEIEYKKINGDDNSQQ